MKIVPFYVPKKFIPKLLNYRNNHLQTSRLNIADNLEKADSLFLEANKDKLAKIARRNDCHLSFVRNAGFYNKSTKMDIGLPYIDSINQETGNPLYFRTYKKEGSSVLPENIARENKPLELIKQDIKTIINLFRENQKNNIQK